MHAATGSPPAAPRENAKWRNKFRDAETRITELTAQVEALQRQQVEALVTKAGVKLDAVLAVSELATMLNDDATISPEKVKAAIGAASEKLGVHPRPADGLYVPAEGRNPAPAAPSGRERWDKAFQPPVQQSR